MALAYSTQNNILHENVGALKCRRPFVVDTSLELNKGAIMSTISWGWMAAISSVVLIIVILFALRVKQMCQSAKSQADT